MKLFCALVTYVVIITISFIVVQEMEPKVHTFIERWQGE